MLRRPRPSILLVLATVAAAAAVVGCGDGTTSGRTVEVTGTVTLAAQPLTDASISFTSLDSAATYSTDLSEQGTYALKLLDAHEGEQYGIAFGAPLEAADGTGETDAAGIPQAPPPPPGLPPRYLEYSTSELTATLDGQAEQSFDFELQK